jgi:hypothetical protein
MHNAGETADNLPEPSPAEPVRLAEAAARPIPAYGEIFRFYFPLALSWIFMALELPISTSVATRSFAPEIQSAALLMLGGLALWIESPVIDLLATSTTLTKGRRDYVVISRFAWYLMIWCTALHAAVSLTPLYDVVTGTLLGVEPEIAEAARIPMAIMIPWSAFIGWRRYLQGILIRFGRTRIISVGTAIRVGTMAGFSFGLLAAGRLSGVEIAAIALVASVASESLFIHWASRQTVRERLLADAEHGDGRPPLTMRRLFAFHMPLTATTMTFMLGLPMVSAALARSHDGVLAMAAWQVATSLIFMHRTVVFALPEPVIALSNGTETNARLARFCAMVGLAASGLMFAFAAAGFDRWFFVAVLKAPPDVARAASAAYLACSALPLIGAMQSYLRGMLTSRHLTVARLAAVIVSTLVLFGSLQMGLGLAWSGVAISAASLSASALAELGVLGWFWRRALRVNVPSPSAS